MSASEDTPRERDTKAEDIAERRGRDKAETAAHFREHDRRLDAINGSIDKNEETTADLVKVVNRLEIEISTMKTKLGFYAALGSLAGGGIVALIVGLASKAGAG